MCVAHVVVHPAKTVFSAFFRFGRLDVGFAKIRLYVVGLQVQSKWHKS